MDRAQKAAAVEDICQIIDGAGVVIVAEYARMTVKELKDLRGKLREQDAQFRVAKNRLVKIALEGRPQAVGADLFKGQTGIAFSKDPVAAAKVAIAYAKSNDKFVVVGGILGEMRLDAAAVKALSEVPSMPEMRARLIGLFQAPMAKLAGLGLAVPQKLVGVVKAYEEKQTETA